MLKLWIKGGWLRAEAVLSLGQNKNKVCTQSDKGN